MEPLGVRVPGQQLAVPPFIPLGSVRRIPFDSEFERFLPRQQRGTETPHSPAGRLLLALRRSLLLCFPGEPLTCCHVPAPALEPLLSPGSAGGVLAGAREGGCALSEVPYTTPAVRTASQDSSKRPPPPETCSPQPPLLPCPPPPGGDRFRLF